MRASRLVNIVLIIVITSILLLSIYNVVTDAKSFVEFSISNTISLLVASVFAFYLNNQLTDKRRLGDKVDSILESLQQCVDKDRVELNNAFSDKINKASIRNMRNKIKLVSDAKLKQISGDDIEYINEKINEYEEVLETYYESDARAANTKIINIYTSVHNKCDKMRIDIYKN